MAKAKPQHLIIQGLFLHYASFWGPLRASKKFRSENHKWILIVITRWIQEYGLNLAVFIMGQLGLIWFFDLKFYFVGSLLLIAMLPGLTVLQMFVDNFRSDSQVYYDPLSKTGVTVKTYINQTGDVVWIFYNHFALPIGARRGKPIRQTLHEQAQAQKNMLGCYAQNISIATYYLNEFTQGRSEGGKRPFLLWNYSENIWQKREKGSFLETIFGIHSVRNSGQIPLC